MHPDLPPDYTRVNEFESHLPASIAQRSLSAWLRAGHCAEPDGIRPAAATVDDHAGAGRDDQRRNRQDALNCAAKMHLAGALTALGELQQHCGVDQRSTATAGINDTNATTPDIIDGVEHPQWMGVWRYDEASQTKELETWLISGNQDKTRTNLLDPVDLLAQPSVRLPASPFANNANAADYVEAPIDYVEAPIVYMDAGRQK